MMKNLSVLLLLLFLSFQVTGQHNKPKGEAHGHEKHAMMDDPEPAAMMYADKVTTRLGLKAEQKLQIKQAQLERMQAQMELKQEYLAAADEEKPNDADYEKEKQKIQEDFREEMKEILNAEQFQKWEAMHKREMKMHSKKKGVQ